MASCDTGRIVSSLYEWTEQISDFSNEKIENTDRLVLNKVKDLGYTERHANNDAVIMGEARQAPVDYQLQDHDAKALITGQMRGREADGNQNQLYTVPINDIPDNACGGQTEIDFAHGYRLRATTDWKLPLTTPIKCVRDFDRQDKKQIRAYFTGVKNQFSRFGLDNFDDKLINLTIQYGEANASVLGANQFALTTGGWQAPPQYRISIHFLQDYKRRIIQIMRGKGETVPPDWKLEIEMPELDWADAVQADQLARNPTGTVYNTERFKDEEGKLRGRSYAEYGGIRCYFNDTPVRGYFKQVGTSGGNPIYRFVRVLEWINVEGETGGLVMDFNPQYDQETLLVDGVVREMVTLIPHIHPKSFQRWGLMKPLKTDGEANLGTNFELKVIDGANIPCNDYNDKFKFVARHEFRFRAKLPEFSGWIAYRHSLRAGYQINVNARNYVAGPQTFASPELYRQPDIDACSQAECAQCGQVADQNLQCVNPESAPASVLTLNPAGAATVASYGVNTTIRLEVLRTGGLGAPASVAYTTANGTATAGADYTTTAGTLNWEADDNLPKYIDVPLLAAATNAENFTVTISSPVGAAIATGASVATLTISRLV